MMHYSYSFGSNVTHSFFFFCCLNCKTKQLRDSYLYQIELREIYKNIISENWKPFCFRLNSNVSKYIIPFFVSCSIWTLNRSNRILLTCEILVDFQLFLRKHTQIRKKSNIFQNVHILYGDKSREESHYFVVCG